MKIIDNFLELDFFNHIQDLLIYEANYKYSQTSVDENGNTFFIASLNVKDPTLNFIAKKILPHTDFKEFEGCYTNMQFNGMDGDWHVDPGTKTALVMISPTLSKGSGQFEIKTDKINKIDFVANRLVIFDAKKKHRGRAPKEINTPRVTLAFKSFEK